MNLAALKEHPYMIAGGVFVLGVILIVIFAGGKATTAIAAAPQSDTQAGTQLAMAQVQASALVHASDNSVLSQQSTNSAAVQIAQIQGATQQNSDLQSYNAIRDAALAQKDTSLGVATITANMNTHISDNQTSVQLTDLANKNSQFATSANVQLVQLANQNSQFATTANLQATQMANQTTDRNDQTQTLQLLARLGSLSLYPVDYLHPSQG